jgi:hypothetical protein
VQLIEIASKDSRAGSQVHRKLLHRDVRQRGARVENGDQFLSANSRGARDGGELAPASSV